MATNGINSTEIPKENSSNPRYQLVAPDGGWGYVIAIAVTVAVCVTAQPMGAFGLVYGGFLRSIGDETTGTTLANSIFNTVYLLTGLLSNYLLKKYSHRIVGLLGAFIFSVGAFLTIFVTNLFEILASFGIIQGLGFGLLLPSVYSALNMYFVTKMNMIMGLCITMMSVVSICSPICAKILMERYGFRGTLALLAALSLNSFPAALSLEPVKRHMLKIPLVENVSEALCKSKTLGDESHQLEPIMENTNDELEKNNVDKYRTKPPRMSIHSLGEGYLSITTSLDEKTEDQKYSMDFFKDTHYLNISIGMSLTFTSDMMFISILPLCLSDFGLSDVSDVATTLSVFFTSDFTSRLSLSGLSAVVQIKNRYLFLFGTLLSAILRCGFVMNTNYYWRLCVCSMLGFLRGFIQISLPLVITEEYPDNFSTAFSLFMVICGGVSLVFGILLSVVKSMGGSNEMVIHMLTLALVICAISWIIEMVPMGRKKNKYKEPVKQLITSINNIIVTINAAKINGWEQRNGKSCAYVSIGYLCDVLDDTGRNRTHQTKKE